MEATRTGSQGGVWLLRTRLARRKTGIIARGGINESIRREANMAEVAVSELLRKEIIHATKEFR
jgi:hypothetical protein